MNLLIKIIFTIVIVTTIFTGCKTSDSTRPSCCLIKIPDITLTGEKTAIERQIIGDYKELEKDAWIVSSVKSSIQKGEGSSGISGGDMELLRAMKIRELHEPKIRKYKDEGAIGETNNGLIVYKKTSRYEKEKGHKRILSIVIEEENSARKTVFMRSLISSGVEKPTEDEISSFGEVIAEEQRATAKKDDWIQEKSGRWVRKK